MSAIACFPISHFMAMRTFNRVIFTIRSPCSMSTTRTIDSIALIPQGIGISIATISTSHEITSQIIKITLKLYNKHEKSTRAIRPCTIIHPAASSIFSIKIPYPLVGSFTSTWVTAPTSLPFWIMGELDTGDCF